jgi:hypothetical protein
MLLLIDLNMNYCAVHFVLTFVKFGINYFKENGEWELSNETLNSAIKKRGDI